MTSMEIIKDFVNDPAVINFKNNDKSRLINVRNHNEKVGENKGIAKIIQAFSKSMSTKEIAKALDLPEEKIKEYINMKIQKFYPFMIYSFFMHLKSITK